MHLLSEAQMSEYARTLWYMHQRSRNICRVGQDILAVFRVKYACDFLAENLNRFSDGCSV